jgi:hypothetical protein
MQFLPVCGVRRAPRAAGNMGNATPPVKLFRAPDVAALWRGNAPLGGKLPSLRSKFCGWQMRRMVAFLEYMSKKEASGRWPFRRTGDVMASDREGGPGNAETPLAAHYIAELADELARLAKSHNLDSLAYILNMARLEADHVAKGCTGSPGCGSPSAN